MRAPRALTLIHTAIRVPPRIHWKIQGIPKLAPISTPSQCMFSACPWLSAWISCRCFWPPLLVP